MKKALCILISVLLLAVCLTACGGTTPNPGKTEEGGYTFTKDDVKIALKTDAAPIIAALGEPMKYTESASCAFEGLDKTYFYGSFYLETYPQGDRDFVNSVWFADDTVSTEEGICIGSTFDAAKAAYPTAVESNGSLECVKGNTKLTVITEDGVVTSIQYNAIHE